MKATVDAELCTGCGLCVDACPEMFDMGDDEIAVVKMSEVPDDALDDCRQAAEDCPTEAITLDE